MKLKLLAVLTLLSLLLSAPSGMAADKADAAAELKALVSKIQTKLQAGQKTEADLAPELKEFDALLAAHKGEKTDEVAQILMMKAMLYEQVLKDKAKGDALMAQLKQDFPDSAPVKMMKQEEESKKLKAALVEGPQSLAKR
jgi:outer membrane protein assembly factor BamD (BamD/ComL family)